MEHFFPDGKKKFSVIGEQRQNEDPHGGPPPWALTGSPLVGHSPSLLIPALPSTLAGLEEVSRLLFLLAPTGVCRPGHADLS